jgi:hypothetical protein
MKSSTICIIKLISIMYVLFSKKPKLCTTKFLIDRTEFCFFRKQNIHSLNKVFDVDCRAFHAASYGIWCFLIKRIQRLKYEMQSGSHRWDPSRRMC